MTFDHQATIEAMLDHHHPRKIAAAEWARAHLASSSDAEFDRARWQRAAEFGVQALTVPRELGGAGASGVEAMLTFEGLGLGATDNGTVFGLASQVFPAQMSLVRFGRPDQLDRWLPGLLDGTTVAAFAMSEPDAGSDTAAIATTATRLDDGRWRLDGTKSWVTLGPVCDLVIVFASTDPAAGRWGQTAFIVETERSGLERTTVAKMGLRSCPFGTLTLDGCVVDDDCVLGGVGAGGSVFTAAVEIERAFLYASQLGAVERILARSIERARSRTQFGQPIGAFQAVAHRIVDMKLGHEAARLLLYAAAARHDRGEPVAVAAALAKLQASESAVSAALDALRTHGAEGYTEALGIEREMRDAIGGLAYSGTSDIQRNIVARLLKIDRPGGRPVSSTPNVSP